MILLNDQEYEETKEQLAQFRTGMETLEAKRLQMDEAEYEGRMSAVLRMTAKLESQLSEYDGLRSGRTQMIECDTLSRVPELLVKARIARHVGVEELARRLKLEVSVLEDYEEYAYQTAPWETIVEAAELLRVRVRSRINLAENAEEQSDELIYFEDGVIAR